MLSGKIIKHEARTCAHGGMQGWGKSYYETYVPIVNWLSIRFLLTVVMNLKMETMSICFAMAHPQADLKTSFFMEVL